MRVATVLAFGVLATACAAHPSTPQASPQGSEPVACEDASQDFPDVADQPTPLEGYVRGCFDARGDKDLFLVQVPAGAGGTLLSYQADAQPEGPDLEILDGNRKRVVIDRGVRGQPSRGWVHVAGGTTVYIRVAQPSARVLAYELRLASAPLVDASEPNSSPEQAAALAVGQTLSGFLVAPANDEAAGEDWFRIDVGSPGKLQVEVDMSQDVKFGLAVVDAAGKSLESRTGKGERLVVEAEIKQPGTYFARLKPTGQDRPGDRGEVPQGLLRPYSIRVTR